MEESSHKCRAVDKISLLYLSFERHNIFYGYLEQGLIALNCFKKKKKSKYCECQ